MCYVLEQIFGWGGEGRTGKKIYRGRSREDNTMKFRCRRTSSRGQSVLQSIAKVRLLEATMSVLLTKGVLKLHSLGHPGGGRGARKI